jgi:hypothetical protein
MSEEEPSINYSGPVIEDESSLPEALRSIFTFAFSTNCHLDEASVTDEERETLATLDLTELFENFKDLIMDLLRFKQKFKHSDMAELANRSEQFETIIQKLEAKVRSHIGVEQQLKLLIETQQGQLDNLQKGADEKKTVVLSDEMKGLKEKITEFEKEAKKKDSDIFRLNHENLKLRKIVEDKSRIIQSLRKTPKGDYMESNEYIKKQIEEQNSQIIKIQQKLKKEIYGWTPKKVLRQKSNKRPNSPNSSSYVSPAFKIAQKYIRGHVRSYSEH